MTPLQTFYNILSMVDWKISEALQVGSSELLYHNFKVKTWEDVQEDSFEGQKYFLYWGNQPVGNLTWDNTDTTQFQKIMQYNFVYLSYSSSSVSGEVSFVASQALNNFYDCYSLGQPCQFFAYQSVNEQGVVDLIPVQPTRETLSQYPGANCANGNC